MKKSIYTILDEKAQSIGPLFLAVSDDEAERTVGVSFPPDSLPRRYPADFALLRLGDIDTANGTLSPHAVPVLVRKLDEVFHE